MTLRPLFSVRSMSLLAGLLLTLAGGAQDCKIIRETDAYTKEIKLSTGFMFIEGGSLTIDADKREIVVLFSVEGPERCFDNNCSVNLSFEGLKGKNMMRNGGTMNCEGLFQLVFRNSPSATTVLQRLMTKKLETLVFTTTGKKELTLTVDPAQREFIRRMTECLVLEARALNAPPQEP